MNTVLRRLNRFRERMPERSEAAGFWRPISRRRLEWMDVTSDALPLLVWVAVIFSAIYAITIVYGAIGGYALPTAAIFSALPHGEVIGRSEKYLPRVLLVIAVAGASIDWGRAAGCELPRLARNEASAVRLFFRWGILILFLISLLALSANGWSGRISSSDQNQTSSFAGLFPHFDALGYYLSPMGQVSTGDWGPFASRRPFAAGMRHLTEAAAGFSYVSTLVLQTFLVAAATFAAARSVIVWRGIWAGLAFCAFSYLITRPFIDTMLTEPLGLAWAFLSVMFLVDSMRLHSARYAFLGLIALTFAEITRMGSIFTIPALILWIALVFGDDLRSRARLFALGCGAVVAVLLVQSLCAYLYGNPGSAIGGNFAYVICGLASGGDWATCPKLYAQEFSRLTTERDQDAYLYAQAIQMILHHPAGLVFGVIRNVRQIISDTPYFMVRGYNGPIPALPSYSLLLLVPGLIFTLVRNRARGELSFWFLVLTSMVASAAIIFQDDGWRTMTATWPFVALLLSMGSASPTMSAFQREFPPLLTVRSGLLLIMVMVVAVVAAPAVTRLWPGRDVQTLSRIVSATGNHETILLGRTLTGFLVVPDDVPLPKQTPAIHSSTFVDLIRNVGIERYYGSFLDLAVKKIPFAFVTGPSINDPNSIEQIYLAPADILTRGPAKAWRLTLSDSLHNMWIRDVVRIEAIR